MSTKYVYLIKPNGEEGRRFGPARAVPAKRVDVINQLKSEGYQKYDEAQYAIHRIRLRHQTEREQRAAREGETKGVYCDSCGKTINTDTCYAVASSQPGGYMVVCHRCQAWRPYGDQKAFRIKTSVASTLRREGSDQ